MNFFLLRSRIHVSSASKQASGVLDRSDCFLTAMFLLCIAKERRAEMDSFWRLFIIPGMGHCAEGPGAWKIGQGILYGRGTDGVNETDHSVLLSIVDWTENENQPTVIIGTDDENVERKHCMWPNSKTVWTGTEWICQSV